MSPELNRSGCRAAEDERASCAHCVKRLDANPVGRGIMIQFRGKLAGIVAFATAPIVRITYCKGGAGEGNLLHIRPR